MTDIRSYLPIIYLSLFIILLGGSAWFIFRQILRTRRIETSLKRLQSKLSQGKGTVEEYYELGAIYLNKKLFSQAIIQFQKALKLPDVPDLDKPAIYNALGYAYFAQEQYDLAIRNYKDAIEILPEYVTALNNMAHAYERKQLASLALETYQKVLKIEPQNATAKRRSETLKRRM